MADRTPITVTDSLGRTLTVRELSALEELDLVEAAGALSDNPRWMNTVRIACSVRDINGTPMAFPKVKEHCRKAVDRVDGPGLTAAVKALYPDAPDDDAAEAPDQAAEDKATAKN